VVRLRLILADVIATNMNELLKLFDSIPTDQIKQINRIATIVSGLGDAKAIFKFIPLKYSRSMKGMAEIAGVVAMVSELILKYRGI